MRTLPTNVSLVFAGDMGARFLGFLAVIHIARVLDPEVFGIVTIGISILMYAVWFSDLGLSILGTREMAKPYKSRGIQLGDILFLKLLLSFIFFIGGQLIVGFAIENLLLRSVVRLYLLSLFAEALILAWYYKGIQNFVPVALARVMSGIIYVAGIYIFVRGPADVMAVPFFYMLGLFISAALLLFWKKGEDKMLPVKRSVKEFLPPVKQSVTIGTGSIFAQIAPYFPPIAIGYIGTVADAGIFGAALKIVFFALVLDRVFIALYLPYLSNQWSINREKFPLILKRTLRWNLLGGFSVSFVITLFAPIIVSILFGAAYSESGSVLAVLSWFIALTLLNSLFSTFLIATGNEAIYFKVSVAGGVIAVVLIILLTYMYGLTGTAAAVVVSEGIMSMMLLRKYNRFLNYR